MVRKKKTVHACCLLCIIIVCMIVHASKFSTFEGQDVANSAVDLTIFSSEICGTIFH